MKNKKREKIVMTHQLNNNNSEYWMIYYFWPKGEWDETKYTDIEGAQTVYPIEDYEWIDKTCEE